MSFSPLLRSFRTLLRFRRRVEASSSLRSDSTLQELFRTTASIGDSTLLALVPRVGLFASDVRQQPLGIRMNALDSFVSVLSSRKMQKEMDQVVHLFLKNDSLFRRLPMLDRNSAFYNKAVQTLASNLHSETRLQTVLQKVRNSTVRLEREPAFSALKIANGIPDVVLGRLIWDCCSPRTQQQRIILTMMMDVYGKCGSVDEMKAMLDRIPVRSRDAAIYNIAFNGFASGGQNATAVLQLAQEMKAAGVAPTSRTVVALARSASACSSLEIADIAWKFAGLSACQSDTRVITAVMDVFGKCGQPGKAKDLFDLLPVTKRDVISWNVLIAACASDAVWCNKVNGLIDEMLATKVIPGNNTVLAVARCASMAKDVQLADRAWVLTQSVGGLKDIRVLTMMVDAYGKCGQPEKAMKVFESIPSAERDKFCWNVMISACASDLVWCAKVNVLIDEMVSTRVPMDIVTLQAILRCAASSQNLQLTDRAWSLAQQYSLTENVHLLNSLVDALGRCGQPGRAKEVFDHIPVPDRDIISWNVLIGACASDAVWCSKVNEFVDQMLSDQISPDIVTVLGILRCAAVSANILLAERGFHIAVSLGLAGDIRILTFMINIYGVAGDLDRAIGLFESIPIEKRALSVWNMMISLYVSRPTLCKTVHTLLDNLLAAEVNPDKITAQLTLQCAAAAKDVTLVERAWMLTKSSNATTDIRVLTTMINAYGKCGQPEKAMEVFYSIPPTQRDRFCWSVMISACASDPVWCTKVNGLIDEMLACDVPIDTVIVLSILRCAAVSANLSLGERAWKFACDASCQTDENVISSMIYLYGKCGRTSEAERLFMSTHPRTAGMFVAMASAYAARGMGKKAMELVTLVESEKIDLSVPFVVVVLQALSHGMMPEEAKTLFDRLPENIRAELTVVTTLIDCFARSGRLEDAELSLKYLAEPDPVALMVILGACRIHQDVPRAVRIYNELVRLRPRDASVYLLMGNIYAKAGMFTERDGILDLMQTLHLKKIPGITTALLKGHPVNFYTNSDDTVHAEMPAIVAKMKEIHERLVQRGYKPDTSWVMQKFDTDEQRVLALCQHGERFAAAFLLLKQPEGEDLMMVGNLRVCGDCHEATKLISKIYNRRIFLRDTSRFHCFENGVCDCCDTW